MLQDQKKNSSSLIIDGSIRRITSANLWNIIQSKYVMELD